MAHVPTAAQLARLAQLQAALVTAEATLATVQSNLQLAQTAAIRRLDEVKRYEAFIYGAAKRPGVIDDGSTGAA